MIRLINEENSYEFKTPVDIRTWMPGKHVNELEIKLPEDVKKGTYKLELGIVDDFIKQIFFATNAPADGKYYVVGEVEV